MRITIQNKYPNNDNIKMYQLFFRKKKRKDKSKNKNEKVNVEENEDKLNHGILTINVFFYL